MEAPARPKKKKHPVIVVLEFLSSLKLAGVLILLLGLLTWFATLEQIDTGILAVKKKYFSQAHLLVRPEIRGQAVPVWLPNGYWVGILFFFNLLLGTLLRVRRRVRTMGVLVAHFGMLFLLVGAFVTQHASQRGNMAINEGETSDVARDYHDYVLEVVEIQDDGGRAVHVIDTEFLSDLSPDDRRTYHMANLPFDLMVTNYHAHARPRNANRVPPRAGEKVVDGYYLEEQPHEPEAEMRLAGCIVEVTDKDGESRQQFLLSRASFAPPTLRWGNRIFLLELRKKLWKMPFSVRLADFRHEYHPGTSRPKSFESSIIRIEEGAEEPVEIRMNEPMRHAGYTFFQASWGPQDAAPGDELFSVFEVVQNPADKWPEYSLWVIGIGLSIHFLFALVLFINSQFKKNAAKATS